MSYSGGKCTRIDNWILWLPRSGFTQLTHLRYSTGSGSVENIHDADMVHFTSDANRIIADGLANYLTRLFSIKQSALASKESD
ncbi:hypothetical protein JXJ21_15300 [candidate division KSB1 bacterium]|nr:hypothetical protein [candidate division KSB1 bacterium]